MHPIARLFVTAWFCASFAVAQCNLPPQWSAATTSSEAVDAIAEDGAGGFYAGGTFTSIGGTPAACIARWNGTSWSPLGSGMAGSIASVSALLRTRTGDLVAAGSFSTAGGVPASNIARWNGSSWSALGSGIGAFGVFHLAEMPNGDLIASGNFTTAGGVAANNIARWNGSSWSALGAGMFSPGGLLVRGNGDLVACGSFSGTFATVARWTGSTWSSIGSLTSMVPNAIVELRNGDLLAAGYLSVQRWNGTAWSNVGALGGGSLTTGYDVARLADGSALVVGAFSTITAGTAVAVNGVGRYEPATSTWNDHGSQAALQPVGNPGRVGHALALADGRVWLYQVPAMTGGALRSVVAVAPGCPASAVPTGSGCAGSAGVNVLAVASLPWLGTSASGVCSNVPAGAVAVGVWGVQSINLPLASVLGGALPGCVGLVSPDILTVHFPVGGAAVASMGLPLDPALSGLQGYLQVVVLESSGAVSASNALQLVLGRL